MTVSFVVWAATTWIALCLLSDLFARWHLRRQRGITPGPIRLSGFLALPVLVVPFVVLELVPAYFAARRWRAQIQEELREMRRDLQAMRHEAVTMRARFDGRTDPDAEEARLFLTKVIAEMDRRLKGVR